MPEEKFLTAQLHELLSYLGQQGVVTIMTVTQAGMVGNMVSPVDTTYLADNVILFRFFEAEGTVRRAISVVKKRNGYHERTIRELDLDATGIVIGEPLTDFHGVLTGVPTYLGSLDPMVMGGVTVKLPLWRSSKQAREVAEAEHTAQAVALEKEAAQNTAVARARDLLAEIDSIRRQRALLDEALIPEGIATLEAARAGYGAGRAEMGVVLDDLTRLLGDRRRLAALSAREVIAAAELERITGLAILGGAR